jgi:hypothetical protein
MSATGNSIANSYWEAKLEPGRKPASGDSHELGSFIRLKYSGQWAHGTWPPSEARQQERQEPDRDRMPPNAPVQAQRPPAQPQQQQQPAAAPGLFWATFDDVGDISSAPVPAARASTQPQSTVPHKAPQQPPVSDKQFGGGGAASLAQSAWPLPVQLPTQYQAPKPPQQPLPPLIDLLSLDDDPVPAPTSLLPPPTVPLFSKREDKHSSDP